MTPLRQKMIDAMLLHGFAERTQSSYLYAVFHLATHYHPSPETLTAEHIQDYFLYLIKERKLAPASCHLALNGLKFLYVEVLKQAWFNNMNLVIPKKPQRIPELLSRNEVERIITACHHPKHHALLSTCYACGLRVSELVALQLPHLDSERHVLRIEQGKGRKDRQVLFTDPLIHLLRRYYQTDRPQTWLFFGLDRQRHISVSSIQKIYTRAKATANIKKRGGIHGLRHAYATHQLEAGVPVHPLQHLLGHKDLQSTLRYVHWSPTLPQGTGVDLLSGGEV